MARFKLPRNPGTDRSNPFLDERGENPFSESVPEVERGSNPYGTGVSETRSAVNATSYVTTLPDRSTRVLAFGVFGMILAVLGIAIAIAGVVTQGNWTWGVAYGIPIQLLGLFASLPSWIFGVADLRAIRSGAMEPTGRQRTRVGLVLGVVGASIGIVPIVGWFALLLANALEM